MFFNPLRLDVAKRRNFPVGGYGSLGISSLNVEEKDDFFRKKRVKNGRKGH